MVKKALKSTFILGSDSPFHPVPQPSQASLALFVALNFMLYICCAYIDYKIDDHMKYLLCVISFLTICHSQSVYKWHGTRVLKRSLQQPWAQSLVYKKCKTNVEMLLQQPMRFYLLIKDEKSCCYQRFALFSQTAMNNLCSLSSGVIWTVMCYYLSSQHSRFWMTYHKSTMTAFRVERKNKPEICMNGKSINKSNYGTGPPFRMMYCHCICLNNYWVYPSAIALAMISDLLLQR